MPWLLGDVVNNIIQFGNLLSSGEEVLGYSFYAHKKKGAKSLKTESVRTEHFAQSLHLAGLISSQQNFSHLGNILVLYVAGDS